MACRTARCRRATWAKWREQSPGDDWRTDPLTVCGCVDVWVCVRLRARGFMYVYVRVRVHVCVCVDVVGRGWGGWTGRLES